MRVFAKNQRESLSVVPHQAERPRPTFEVNRSAIKESFRGWLQSVAGMTNDRALRVPAAYRVPRLTALDVSRVNKATIREGESHCVWPPSVIREFNKADVITTGEVDHYMLRDASLTRVEYKKRHQSNAQSPVLQMLAERD